MDLYDKKILYYLDTDARMPASTIGRYLQLSKEAVNNRILKLQKEGIIAHNYAIIDASKLGFQAYRIAIKFYQSTLEQEREIVKQLRKEKTCAHLLLTEGKHNILFLVMHKNFSSLQTFFDKFMTTYGDIIAEKEIHIVNWHERHNQRHTHNGRRVPLRITYDKIESKQLSIKQREVLTSYAKSGRKKIAQTAKELDQEPQNVRYHLKKLEQENIIKGYGIGINQDKLGKQHIVIDITLKHPKALHKVRRFFEQKPESIFTTKILGKYDLSIELIVKDDKQLREIMNEFREIYKNEYIDYDLSMCYEEYVLTWSPF